MKKILSLLTCLSFLTAFNNQNNAKAENTESAINEQITSVKTDSINCVTSEAKSGETLNDIRFAGWCEKEWADNEYIRTIRKYIDAYNNGEITDTDLDEHKTYIQGKFVIADIQPYLLGGVLVYIVFYDHPEKTFSSFVYSEVNEKTRAVSNYECRGLRHENINLGLSQEDILQFLKECPEHKMW